MINIETPHLSISSVNKLRFIVVIDNKVNVYTSIPLCDSMTLETINNIIAALSAVMPKSFYITLE